MTRPRPNTAWLAELRAQAQRAPLVPRVALLWGDVQIGSIEPQVPALLGVHELLQPCEATGGWRVLGEELTATLSRIAEALHTAGFVHSWRDEQLAVTDDAGRVLGTIERGAVRTLGIATRAVHLLGMSPDGRHWVQQRALDKHNDPGLWDTLMGGMVPACDTLEAALARETWEEAGLRLDQLAGLRHCGHVLIRGPSTRAPAGYVIERLDWFCCTVPADVEPCNQDGEVAQFRLMTAGELCERMERGEFTAEAALALTQAVL